MPYLLMLLLERRCLVACLTLAQVINMKCLKTQYFAVEPLNEISLLL